MIISDLPPTSYATEGYIHRAFYIAYMQVYSLGDFSRNPREYGLMMENECLVARKYHRDLPDKIALKCNCLKCATRSYPYGEKNVNAAYSVNARQTITAANEKTLTGLFQLSMCGLCKLKET